MGKEKGIVLSQKHGLNPTMPVCFWCGEETGEIALMGKLGNGSKDVAAPKHMVLSYEPCEKCKANWAKGFTLIEATRVPNTRSEVPMQEGVYPTGRYAVITKDAAHRIFPEWGKYNAGFLTPGDFMAIVGGKS